MSTIRSELRWVLEEISSRGAHISDIDRFIILLEEFINMKIEEGKKS